jgi:hypothetical protein
LHAPRRGSDGQRQRESEDLRVTLTEGVGPKLLRRDGKPWIVVISRMTVLLDEYLLTSAYMYAYLYICTKLTHKQTYTHTNTHAHAHANARARARAYSMCTCCGAHMSRICPRPS